VSAQTFESQLDIIQSTGLSGCSIAAAMERSGEGCVAISFDDGNLGQYEFATEALLRRSMTATFFVTTSWVGREGFVTWDQLREMKDAGMSIQSHTHTHPFLSELKAASLSDELRKSKETIDAAMDQDTVSLALPGGNEPRRTLRHLVPESGYTVIATSSWGTNFNPGSMNRTPLRIRRCTIQGKPIASDFQKILNGDSWLDLRRRTRGAALNGFRAILRPSRYARLRRRTLDRMGRLTSRAGNG
jgi:peptidoglycan/xylan/chitin deacetylase (PgdA/CDA1 family)